MNNITKLRHLIWDIDKKVFTEDELLDEFLEDCRDNVYKTAALVLDVVRANPERITDYKRGGVNITKQNLDRAVRKYEEIGGSKITTVQRERVIY
jgi:L-rhamnose isomerase